MARIICGPNEIDNTRYDGKSIEEVRTELQDILNIPSGATMLLNEERVQDAHASLRAGDELEFVKAAGDKGIR